MAGEVTIEEYTARELWRVFSDSPEKALAWYAGKRILVTGVVTESGPSVYATPKVELSDHEEGRPYAACILPRSDFPMLRKFRKGMRVTFGGTCRGLTFDREMVLLKECMVIE
ncbi:MAG: OB-fold putative lipoprotein [Deltaproteobacteria bacterium]|nr:OB-fold putative lipoprotein [Deltaproteobacteria bacterium]